ncbi:helix-turn-helix domain-containing protein [Streptomyces sp. BH034]
MGGEDVEFAPHLDYRHSASQVDSQTEGDGVLGHGFLAVVWRAVPVHRRACAASTGVRGGAALMPLAYPLRVPRQPLDCVTWLRGATGVACQGRPHFTCAREGGVAPLGPRIGPSGPACSSAGLNGALRRTVQGVVDRAVPLRRTAATRAGRSGPLVHGWADQRWPLARIRTLIGRLFHVSCTVEDTWRLLKRHGWSWQQPTRRAIEPDDDAVEVWKKKAWPRTRAPRRSAAPGSSVRARPGSR